MVNKLCLWGLGIHIQVPIITMNDYHWLRMLFPLHKEALLQTSLRGIPLGLGGEHLHFTDKEMEAGKKMKPVIPNHTTRSNRARIPAPGLADSQAWPLSLCYATVGIVASHWWSIPLSKAPGRILVDTFSSNLCDSPLYA